MTEEWDTTWLVAEIWCCDDEEDGLCYQPRIWTSAPAYRNGYHRRDLKTVWEGTFRNEPEGDEMAGLKDELRAECRKRGIQLDERPGWSPYARVPVKPKENE